MLAQFSIIPVGEGSSISDKLIDVVKMVDSSGLDYRMGSMGTVVEGELDEVLTLLKKCHQSVLAKSERVYTVISIDDRKGYTQRIIKKIEAVEQKAGISVKK